MTISFWDWFVTTFQENLGLSFYYTTYMVSLMFSAIMAAKEVSIGLIFSLVFSTLFYIWFYTKELNTLYPLIGILLSIAGLALITYSQTKKAGGGMI